MRKTLNLSRDVFISEKSKKEIEEKLNIKVYISKNLVELEGEDWISLKRVENFFRALELGFEEEDCKKLLKENFNFEIIRIKDFVKNLNNRNRLKELKGRIIGIKGKVKRNIEKLTNSKITIYRNLIGIISDEKNIFLARRSIEMILEGRMHSTVYSFINRRLREEKI